MTRAVGWGRSVMINENDLLETIVGLQRDTLHFWVERGWVLPEKNERGRYRFHEIDVARVGLIYEFSIELDLNDDAMDVILPLIDQVYGLRRQLKSLADAVNTQPENVRKQIIDAIASPDD